MLYSLQPDHDACSSKMWLVSSGYYPAQKCSIHLKCRPVCRRKVCSRRRCKRVRCGSRKVCRKIIKIRIVKIRVKIDSYDGYGYGPKYGIRIKKIPRKVIICHLIPKSCTRCHTIRYVCGKICTKVCRKIKKVRHMFVNILNLS